MLAAYLLVPAVRERTIVNSGGEEVVHLSATTISATIGAGGWEVVESGGTASGTIVLSAGHQDVQKPAAMTISTVVESGGFQDLGGSSLGTILSGGTQFVGGNGPLSGVFVSGTASGTTVYNGGLQQVASGSTAISTTVFGGTELVEAGGTAVAPVIDGGTVELAVGSVVSGAISFGTGAGTLRIDDTTMPGNVISGFAPGDTIDLAGVTSSGGGSAVLTAGNVLVVSEGGNSYDLQLDPSRKLRRLRLRRLGRPER